MTGTAAAGATITFTSGTTTLGTVIADPNSGAYTFNPAATGHTNIGQGQQTITATETLGTFSSSTSLGLTYDTVAPTAVSITPSTAGPTNASSLTETVTFSEGVGGVDAADFTLATTGTATGTIAAVSGSQGTYNVVIDGVTGNGTLGLDLNASGTGIQDIAGNPIQNGLTGATTTIDTTPPGAPTVALISDTGSSPTDGITSNPAYTATTTEAGGTLLYSADGGAYTTAAPAFATDGSADGRHTVAVEQRDGAGNVSAPGSVAFTLDDTAPAVTIASPGGNTTAATQILSGTVADANPGATVSLYDNGSATAFATTMLQSDGTWSTTASLAQGANSVVARDTDLAGNTGSSAAVVYTLGSVPAVTERLAQDTGASASDGVTRVSTMTGTADPGATVGFTVDGTAVAATATADGSGAYSFTPTGLADGPHTIVASEANSFGTGSSPAVSFTLDTTPPVAASPTLTVAQNSGPTPIGIAAPSDNLTPAGSLAIVAGALPSDGTVTLADGTTAVTAGESLTAAQLAGLEFTPTAGLNNQGSTFAYTVTDGAGNSTAGTAALNVGSAAAPTITGTHATTDQAEAPVQPFSGVTVSDPSSAAGATETLTISLTGAGGALTGAGLTAGANGSYQLAGTAAQVTQALDALSFTPTAGAPGTTSTTAFVLTDASSAGTSVADSGTSVADTATAAPPPPPPPPPPPVPTPDAVSISPAVTYKDGIFTLTGTASSPSGVGSVEISAVVDGVRQDLGPASVNPNGTFVFQDAALDQQSFFVATETDRAGGQATSADPGFNLAGGLGPTGGIGKEENFDAAGQVSTTLYRSNGSRSVGVEAANQTVDLQPFDIVSNHQQAGTSFVFSRGDGLDVIHGFQVGGAGHDTLDLPSSDFTNLTDVLRHTGDVNGSAFITDPKTGDAIRLAGVTTAELKVNPKDFAFHA